MGEFTDIVQIVVPSSAQAGQVVSVEAKVKNIYSAAIVVTMTGDVNGALLAFGSTYHNIDPGATTSFYDSFIMPSAGVRLYAWSFYYGVDNQWHYDDDLYVDIALSGEVAPDDASIVSKWLIYDGIEAGIPVTSISQGESVKVKVRVRNNSEADKKLGIAWSVVDKDGNIVHTYSHFEAFATAPGDTQDFVSPTYLSLTAVGEYRTRINLFIYPEEFTPSDYYDGVLCTVVAPEVQGEFTSVMIELEGSMFSLPVVDVAVDSNFLLHVWARNTSLSNYKFGLRYIITKPNGAIIERLAEELGITWANDTHHFEEGPTGLATQFNVDQAGVWNIELKLYGNEVLVATYSSVLLTAAVSPPSDGIPGYTLITDYIYPYAAQYNGQAEEVTFEFSLTAEQVPGTAWSVDRIVNALEDEVMKEGAKMLKLQVYEDTSPTLTTDYRIIATSTVPTTSSALALPALPWALIIVAVLAILFIVAITFAVIQTRKLFWGQPDGDGVDGGIGGIGAIGEIISLMVVVMMMSMVMQQMPTITEKVERLPYTVVEKVKEYGPKLGRKAWEEGKELIGR